MNIAETEQVWQMIGDLSVGTIIAWAAVIIAIIAGISVGLAKLFGLYAKYHKMRDEKAKQIDLVAKHEETLGLINESLKEIKAMIKTQSDVNLKELRYLIVQACDGALADGRITQDKLKSIEEMFDEYVGIYHANGYVKTMVERVRKLRIDSSRND